MTRATLYRQLATTYAAFRKTQIDEQVVDLAQFSPVINLLLKSIAEGSKAQTSLTLNLIEKILRAIDAESVADLKAGVK